MIERNEETQSSPIFSSSIGKECSHCHGKGKHVCEKCHGEGNVGACHKCHGEKEIPCETCSGTGLHCSECDGTGKVECGMCDGSGERRNPRMRYKKCRECHGSGWLREVGEVDGHRCSFCGGSGRIGEVVSVAVTECTTCHGTGELDCPHCHGTGYATCPTCKGAKKIRCKHCEGEGVEVCDSCGGYSERVCVECYGTGKVYGAGENDHEAKESEDLKAGKDKYRQAEEICAKFLQKKAKLPKEALSLYEDAARLGCVDAQCELGNLYIRGSVVDRDSVRGFKLLRDSVAKGCARAALLASYLYSHDIENSVVDKDYAKENELLGFAANQGVAYALYYLGEHYLEGSHGIKKNEAEAKRLLGLAIEKTNDAKLRSRAKQLLDKVPVAVRLTKNCASNVIGVAGPVGIPKFFLEEDVDGNARRIKAEIADRDVKYEKERKRETFKVNFARGVWWFLFRIAAALALLAVWQGCHGEWAGENQGQIIVLWYLITSYFIRPKYNEAAYFFGTLLALCFLIFFAEAFFAFTSGFLLLVMTTLFMRGVGEKLALPLITYPLLGGLIGYLCSPCLIINEICSSGVTVTIYLLIAVITWLGGLALVNAMGSRCAADGCRTPKWTVTILTILMACLLVGLVSHR